MKVLYAANIQNFTENSKAFDAIVKLNSQNANRIHKRTVGALK